MIDPKAFLVKLNKNLNILREREAKYGGNSPLDLLNQIADHKTAIVLIEQAIAGHISEVELEEALKPLLLAVNNGQVVNIESDTYIVGDVTGDIVHGDKFAIGEAVNATVAAGDRSAAASKGGVAISGDVEGNLIISIGNTQATIPRSVQFAMAVVMLGVIFLVIVQGYNAYTAAQPNFISPMRGDFNIVVTHFQVAGQGDGLNDAQELAQSFVNAIDREMDELADKIDQRIEIRSPQETESITGATEEERAEAAHALAEKINADVVIYGTVEVNGKAARIEPEFYVKTDDLTAAANVVEITGQYRMGSEILIDKVDNITRKREVANILADRFRALTYVFYGLADFVIGQYESAEVNFSEVLKIEAWDNSDVIYVLLGNSALKQPNLVKAEEYYRQALKINPSYSRAYAGLGSVLYAQALGDKPGGTYDTINLELLNRSIETYQKALDPSMDYPPLADITTKANFGMGQSHLLRANFEAARGNGQASERDLALAIQAFRIVIQDYEEGNNLRVKELAAHAHGRLGLIYRLTAQPEKAISEYEQALNLLPLLDRTRERRATYEAALGDIYIKLKQPSKAIEWYERAVENALAGSNLERRYRKILDELQ